MPDFKEQLKKLVPKHDFLIGIDSDGCVFDTMEIKQKECFCPNNIKYFGLQAVSKYAREATEFVNLYSKQRGLNRYNAILVVLALLSKRREVLERGVKVPELKRLQQWTQEESVLSKSVLRALVLKTGDAELKNVLAWSDAIDVAIEELATNIPAFPLVRKSLEKASRKADILVVSQTPLDVLQREWDEHDLTRFVCSIAGQEHGTKAEHIAFAMHGKYAPERVLMIGDALGDYQAAQQNAACFFPVVPGSEERSWRRFMDESLARFFAGTFKGAYEFGLKLELDAALPESPCWQADIPN